MKVYNEIVIDMNPESDTYMDVLYEDSYEHDGDVMLELKRFNKSNILKWFKEQREKKRMDYDGDGEITSADADKATAQGNHTRAQDIWEHLNKIKW